MDPHCPHDAMQLHTVGLSLGCDLWRLTKLLCLGMLEAPRWHVTNLLSTKHPGLLCEANMDGLCESYSLTGNSDPYLSKEKANFHSMCSQSLGKPQALK